MNRKQNPLGIFFSGLVCFAALIASAQQSAVSDQSSAISAGTRVTLDGDFVQFDKTAKTVDVTVGGVTKHAIFQERYPIKKDHLESILASLKPGDKATFVGEQRPDGTLVIRTILCQPKTVTDPAK